MITDKNERYEFITQIVNEVGSVWLEKISDVQLSYFLLWAVEGQVYFYPGNNEKLGDAFRGYVAGCMGIKYLGFKYVGYETVTQKEVIENLNTKPLPQIPFIPLSVTDGFESSDIKIERDV